MATQDVLPQLYQQLNICTGTDDYLRSRRIAEQIMKADPTQWDAFYTKLVCFVHESNFEAVIRNIASHNFGDKSKELAFIHAYTLYRLNRHQDALNTLSKNENGIRELELRAQILYKMERYEDSVTVYQHKLSQLEDIDSDRLVNQLAALSLCPTPQECSITPDILDTYEQLYNYSSVLIAVGDAPQALDYLEKAESTAVNEMTQDPDYSQEELEDEMSVIRVQKAFASQLVGQTKEASKIYTQLIKKRISDHSVSAIASNNVISINKDKDIFDSRKRMKACTSEAALKKMTSQQRSIVHFNKCLLAINTNQLEQARSYLQHLRKIEKNGNELVPLLELSIQRRNEGLGDSKGSLLDLLSRHKDSPSIALTLAQIALNTHQLELCCEIICSTTPICYKPSFVSFVVTAYLRLGEFDKIDEVLTTAINYWLSRKDTESKSIEHLKKFVCHSANFKLQRNCYREAGEILEKFEEYFQDDRVYSQLLISSFAAIDITKAEKVLSSLDQKEIKKVNVDELEKVQNLRQVISKKTPLLDKISKKDDKPDRSIKSKRKSKKKKGKLPKNYNPDKPPDPERWLPMRERSYNKKLRKKGGRKVYARSPHQSTQSDKPEPKPMSANQKKKQQQKSKKKGKRW
ncbi:Signal recognition particle subunit SRP72-like [Oopsacas minuta]|uniref:Signal recognition particle subunit SRP72 n=1 Tax=Oopsacas minuta TaxID=111878 RepID=A0AAV7K6Z0_9METZ|nr:Signal recognition particle subunit SRP72-like [Oopsacas minuta]